MNPTASRLEEVQHRIAEATLRSGRAVGKVNLVAVAKTATPDTLKDAWAAGQRCFGHNRVEALEEHRQVLPTAEWHLLGPLQGRKVRRGMAAADLYQALGESRTLERCARALNEAACPRMPVLVQVNLHPEDGRYGCSLSDLDELLDQVAETAELRCVGLMTLALATDDDAILRNIFSTLHERFRSLQSEDRLPADALLSMGMSGDFETAIEEGANLVRVGRAIFPPPVTT